MRWHLRSYASWYLMTERKSSKEPGVIVARIWLAGDKWLWSSMSGRSGTGCKTAGLAKKAARRSLSNKRIVR